MNSRINPWTIVERQRRSIGYRAAGDDLGGRATLRSSGNDRKESGGDYGSGKQHRVRVV